MISPMQTVLENLTGQLSAVLVERNELLARLENGTAPPHTEPAAGGPTYSCTERERFLSRLRSRTPHLKSLAQAIASACDAADWESFK